MYHIIAKAGVCSECNCSLPLGQLSWVLRTPLVHTLSRRPDSSGLMDSLGSWAHSFPASQQLPSPQVLIREVAPSLMAPLMNHQQPMAMGFLLFKVNLVRTNAPCLKARTTSNSASVEFTEVDAEPFSEE